MVEIDKFVVVRHKETGVLFVHTERMWDGWVQREYSFLEEMARSDNLAGLTAMVRMVNKQYVMEDK